MDRKGTKELAGSAVRRMKGLARRALERFVRATIRTRRLDSRAAYRLWSRTYDAQPRNPVLAVEREIFDNLLAEASIAGKDVVDVGCGTGRHWEQLFSRQPRTLHGVDSSPEMLARLAARHPRASLHRRDTKQLIEFGDASFDCVVSTLMLGHVRDAEAELREWTRLLKPGGEVIYTDFHPDALRKGAKRVFRHGLRTFEVESYTHDLGALRSTFRSLRLEPVRFEQRTAGPEAQLLVFGFRLRKAASGDDPDAGGDPGSTGNGYRQASGVPPRNG